MNTYYPWQESTFLQLMQRKSSKKMPHALLLSGPGGIGKLHFAKILVNAMLCQQPDQNGNACGECTSCHLIKAGTHPDFHELVPEEDAKTIRIDQIRALAGFMSLKSHYSGYKTVLIHPADLMNRAAANSLLKNLEEPSGDTLILLVTDRPGYLLPTIRSRCQVLPMSKPQQSMAREWLEKELNASHETTKNCDLYLDFARGAPVKALQMAQNKLLEKHKLLISQLEELGSGKLDAVSLAQAWKKHSVPQVLQWMGEWVSDIIKLKFVANFPLSNNSDISLKLQGLAGKVEAQQRQALFRYLDRLNLNARLAEGQINQELLLEDAMICWNRIFR